MPTPTTVSACAAARFVPLPLPLRAAATNRATHACACAAGGALCRDPGGAQVRGAAGGAPAVHLGWPRSRRRLHCRLLHRSNARPFRPACPPAPHQPEAPGVALHPGIPPQVDRPEQYHFDRDQLLVSMVYFTVRLAEQPAFVQAVSTVRGAMWPVVRMQGQWRQGASTWLGSRGLAPACLQHARVCLQSLPAPARLRAAARLR